MKSERHENRGLAACGLARAGTQCPSAHNSGPLSRYSGGGDQSCKTVCKPQAARLVVQLLLVFFFLLPPAALFAHESPIDHIDRVVQIYVDDNVVHVLYTFRCEERQVMLQLMRMDTNNDGKISDEERAAWFDKTARELTEKLHLEVEGKPLTLTASPPRLSPDLSQTYHFTAPLPALSPGEHAGKFTDEFSREHPGDYRWRPRDINTNGYEVAAVAAPGLEQLGPHPAMVVVNLRVKIADKR